MDRRQFVAAVGGVALTASVSSAEEQFKQKSLFFFRPGKGNCGVLIKTESCLIGQDNSSPA